MIAFSAIQQCESVISVLIPLPLEPLSQSFIQHYFRDCFVWLHKRHRAEVGGESQKILRQPRQHLPCLKAAWQVRGLWPTRRDLLIVTNVVSPAVETRVQVGLRPDLFAFKLGHWEVIQLPRWNNLFVFLLTVQSQLQWEAVSHIQ